MARKKHVDGSLQEVNLTPMIDCTFQLVLFFILTAQMASQEKAKVTIAEPYMSMAIGAETDSKGPKQPKVPNVTVNVVNKYGDKKDDRQMDIASKAEFYQIGMNKINAGDIEALTKAIKDRKAQIVSDKVYNVKPKDVMVEIRADKDIAFQDIEPVMRAAAEAELVNISLTAIVDSTRVVK